MVAYQYRPPAGIPGSVVRYEGSFIESQAVDPANPPLAFGVPTKIVSGLVQPLAAGDAVTAIAGINVRSFPGSATQDPLGTSTPPTSGSTSIMVRGYINVTVRGAASPIKRGTVYVRVASPASGKPVGGFEAAADGANTVILPNSYFMGPPDAFGNVEIAYNI